MASKILGLTVGKVDGWESEGEAAVFLSRDSGGKCSASEEPRAVPSGPEHRQLLLMDLFLDAHKRGQRKL